MQTSFTASDIISFGSTSMQKASERKQKAKKTLLGRKEQGEWENLFMNFLMMIESTITGIFA